MDTIQTMHTMKQKGGRDDCRGVDFAFLDSGTGGIPYMMELKHKMPGARCVYVGDTAHFPYGEKSADEVTESAAASIAEIVRRWDPDTLVIACNTISVTSLAELRSRFSSLPIVGTVPAIRLAARVSRNKRIGLLATNATVRHPYCEDLIRKYAADCKIFKRGDPDLISFIEHSLFTATAEERMAAVQPAVSQFLDQGCDTIILGCTHFTHVAGSIAAAAGKDVQVVDSRDGVAKQALKVWQCAETEAGDAARTGTAAVQSPSASLPYRSDLPADKSFFVTKLRSPEDEEEYRDLCASFRIPWGGEIQINAG